MLFFCKQKTDSKLSSALATPILRRYYAYGTQN